MEDPQTKTDRRAKIRDKKNRHKIHGKGLAEWYRRVIEKTKGPQHPLEAGV